MSVAHLLGNPYDGVDISIIVPSAKFETFNKLYLSLINGFSGSSNVELLVKIDDTSEIDLYYEICEQGKFKYKILMYPKYNSRSSLHIFYNDLGRISSGKIIWILTEDAIIRGNWDQELMNTRGKYKDNIYSVIIPFDNGRGINQILPSPAITKEWVNLFGCITEFPNFDRWIHELSKGINRRVILTEDQILISMPKGNRGLSKEDKKKIFYPRLSKVIRRAKKKL